MHRSKTQSRNPSFSSTLLDEIYNSIDAKTQNSQSFLPCINTTKKQSNNVTKKSVPDKRDRFLSSVSSSSDSNSSVFSSSDTELTHCKKIPLCFGPSKTKPRKTEHQNRNIRMYYNDYDYAFKTKTPASPGGRIVNFINSLFNSKQSMAAVKSYPRKTSLDDDSTFVKKPNDYYNPSTCSSASSFSRSYLNKSSSDCIKRNVRFSPVRKSVKKNVEEGGRRSVEEIAREFLRDYHKKNHENSLVKNNEFEDYEDDDVSDSSSDLFELDLVGNHRNVYGDELPVYETTFAGLIM